MSLLVLPFISLVTPVYFRDSAASETQLPQTQQRQELLFASDTAAARVQFFSKLARSRTPGNKRRGLSISSLLTIAVLKFQLWNLFCATAWIRTQRDKIRQLVRYMNRCHLESRPSALRKHLPKALFKLAVWKEVGNARLLANILFAEPLNVVKSTNDLLYFMNRFH